MLQARNCKPSISVPPHSLDEHEQNKSKLAESALDTWSQGGDIPLSNAQLKLAGDNTEITHGISKMSLVRMRNP